MIGAITAGLYAGGVPPVTNSYESIATSVVGSGGASDITFSSIPSTYKHLQIRGIGKSASTSNGLWINFNGDGTAGNYNAHYLFGYGSSTPVSAYESATPIVSYWPISSTGASIFGAAVIDILDYTNTNKYTTVRTLGGYDANGSGYAWFNSTLWSNTAAINSVTLKMANSNNLAQYSSFALYGIKG